MMYNNKTQFTALTLVLALAALPAMAALAAETQSGQLEEIVVTAQKREQRLSDVGISVSVLSETVMRNAKLQLTTDIIKLVPNLENISIFGPGTNTNFSLRGVAQNDFNDGTESPIATYVDDVYLVVTGAGSFPLYDMQRVEVLRGPQGTLFGRNSTGGLIHFLSADPGKENSASASASFGSYQEQIYQGFVNTALSDKVQVRIAGYYSNKNGWQHNITGNQPDAGQLQTMGVRLGINFEPTDRVKDTLKLSFNEAEGHSSGIWRDAIGQNPVVTVNGVKVSGGDLFVKPAGSLDGFGIGPTLGGNTDNGQVRRLNPTRSFLAVNKLVWNVADHLSVTSVTAYNSYLRDVVEDCDGSQAQECATHYKNPSHQITEEVRAYLDEGSARYTFGVFGLTQRVFVDTVAPILNDGVHGGLVIVSSARQKTSGEAIFANGEFDLSPQFTFIAGLRGAHDEKHINESYIIYLPPPGFNPANPFPSYVATPDIGATGDLKGATAVVTNNFDDQNAGGLNSFSKYSVSGKLELDYKPEKGVLFYGSASRGTKAPGFNHGFIAGGLAKANFPYAGETLYAYEVGSKFEFWDHRASLNTAIYHYNYKNYQALSFAAGGVGGSSVSNYDAKLTGGEIEFNIKPASGLTFSINAGYSNAKTLDVPNSGGVVADRKLPIAPEWTASTQLRYETPLATGDNIVGFQVSAHARASFFTNPDNDPAAQVPGETTIDAGTDLSTLGGKLRFALTVKNLADKRYVVSIFPLLGVGGIRYGFYGDPRWFSGEVSYHF